MSLPWRIVNKSCCLGSSTHQNKCNHQANRIKVYGVQIIWHQLDSSTHPGVATSLRFWATASCRCGPNRDTSSLKPRCFTRMHNQVEANESEALAVPTLKQEIPQDEYWNTSNWISSGNIFIWLLGIDHTPWTLLTLLPHPFLAESPHSSGGSSTGGGFSSLTTLKLSRWCRLRFNQRNAKKPWKSFPYIAPQCGAP